MIGLVSFVRRIHLLPIALGVCLPSLSLAQNAAAPRRIWADSSTDLIQPGPSPDGRFLAFTDWLTGDLAVRDLTTGQNRHLTSKGGWEKSNDFALFPLISPDGKSVAYTWYRIDPSTIATTGAPKENVEIRVMSLDGSNDRRLIELTASKGFIVPTDWSRDGSMVVATGTDENAKGQLLMFPVDGGAARVVKRFPDYRFPDARLSPDGKYLAYTYMPNKADPRGETYMLALESGRTTTVREVGDAKLIGWIDDGQLAFSSERGGSPGIWKIRIEGGAAKGAPTLVRKDMWRTAPGRLVGDGRYVYTVRSGDQEVYLASYDDGGKLRANPIPISGRPGEQHGAGRWSSDGKYVAFVTQEHRTPMGTSVTIYSVGSGERRVLRPPVITLQQAIWIPGAQSLALRGSDEQGRGTLYRYDLKTGNLAPLLVDPGAVPTVFSRDGKRLFYVPPRGPRPARRLVARDLATGVERDVFTPPDGFDPAGGRARIVESADGRWLAYSSLVPRAGMRFDVVPATGGDARTILVPATDPRTFATLLGFTRDGQQLIYSLHGPNTNKGASMWRIPIRGGEPTEMEAPEGFRAPNLSPDGLRLVYWAGGLDPEVWMLDDPALRASGGGRAGRN